MLCSCMRYVEVVEHHGFDGGHGFAQLKTRLGLLDFICGCIAVLECFMIPIAYEGVPVIQPHCRVIYSHLSHLTLL